MRNKLIQYALIAAILTAIGGGYFYFRSEGSVTQKQGSIDGLVGYWDFEEGSGTTAYDRTSSGNNGTITGGTYMDGKIGGGLEFDADGENINAGDINDMDGQNYLTISFWLNVRSYENWRGIISKGSGSTHIYAGIGASDFCGANRLYFMMRNGDSNSYICTSSDVNVDEWHHYMIVFDGTQSTNAEKFKFYLDTLQDTLTFTNGNVPSTTPDTTSDFIIGNAVITIKSYLDEVRVYNRAISQSEISELYQQGSAKINASQETKLTDGLVGHWSFDGNHMDWSQSTAEARDQSSTGAHGNVTGATATIGKIGQTLDFTGGGSDDWVRISDSSALDGMSAATLSAWVYLDSVAAGKSTIIGKADYDLNVESYFLAVNSTNFSVDFWNDPNTPSSATSATVPSTGQWYHVAGTYDGSSVKIYVNGVDDDTTPGSLSGNIYNSNTDLGIGARLVNGVTVINDIDGKIDEVRIYNRALSADEISQLYNMGK